MAPATARRGAIVFGGAGFVGTHLLRELTSRGVTPLVSADIAAPVVRVAGVDYVTADVRRPIEIPGDFDTAYNLAAVHRTPGHRDAEYYDTNVLGALHVTRHARDRGISSVVFASSISVYGTSEQELDETSPISPTTAYGRSKEMAEAIHRIWRAEDDARRLIVVRPAVTFGPGEGGNFDRLLRSLRTRTFAYPGRLDTVKSCGHVTDLVGSIEWALARVEREIVYNFCYPERTTIELIATTMAEEGGLPRPRIRLPLRPMLGAARVVEAVPPLRAATGVNRARVMKLVESTNVRPDVLVRDGYPFRTDLRSGVALWLRDIGQQA